MFLEHEISILEWFLKDHVTLKTGVNSAFAIKGINCILKYIKREKSSNNISQYYNFYCIFYQINVVFVSIL